MTPRKQRPELTMMDHVQRATATLVSLTQTLIDDGVPLHAVHLGALSAVDKVTAAIEVERAKR